MEGHRSSDSHYSVQSDVREPPSIRPPKFSELTEEEQRILRQCKTTSFWNSCVPLAAGLTISTYYGLKTGFLKPKSRFAPPLLYAGAAITGLLVGKLLYYPICYRNILQSCPDGVIATRNREMKQWREDVKAGRVAPNQVKSMYEQRRQAQHSPSPAVSTPNTQDHTQQPHGAETGGLWSQRTSQLSHDHADVADTQPLGADQAALAPKQFSYAEARRLHRAPGEYRPPDIYPGVTQPPQRLPPSPTQLPPPADRPQPAFTDEPRYPAQPTEDEQPRLISEESRPRGRKNEYGDEWEE